LRLARAHRGDEAEHEHRNVHRARRRDRESGRVVRHWVDSDGTEGSTVMKYDYGFIVGVRSAPTARTSTSTAGRVASPSGSSSSISCASRAGFVEYDEDKVMIGWARDDARRRRTSRSTTIRASSAA
jgi:hypothetical protein